MLQMILGLYAFLEVLSYILRARLIDRIRHIERILLEHAVWGVI